LNHEIYCSNILIIFDEITSRLFLRIFQQNILIIFTKIYLEFNSIRTNYTHKEQITDIIRIFFEQFTINALSASSNDILFKESTWKTSVNNNNNSYITFLLFLSVNDHTASSLQIIFEKVFYKTRVLFFREFFLVYHSFLAWVVL
jgi:hypothetical protein